ncbi:MAG TPA: hypothetical protein VFQ63_03980 [Patescibacteria group bacterium]|nr:hypothetical protein [Patescibacteria group bacterium]
MTKKFFAQVISFIFHPIFFTLFIPLLIVHRKTGDWMYSFKWTAFSGVFLLVALLFFYIVRPKDFFSDFDISKKEQRHLFYSISLLLAVMYFIAALIFKGILFPLSIVSLGIILGLVVFDIVNYYIKASIHLAVVTAYVVTMAIVYGLVPFFAMIGMVALVGWSRIYLKKHTQAEAVAGMLLGAAVTVVTFWISLLIKI